MAKGKRIMIYKTLHRKERATRTPLNLDELRCSRKESNSCSTYGTKKKSSFKTGDLLKEVQIKFSMTGQEKLSFNTDKCLIEVTKWAGLTVLRFVIMIRWHYFNKIKFIHLITSIVQCMTNLLLVNGPWYVPMNSLWTSSSIPWKYIYTQNFYRLMNNLCFLHQ
jgi:hypothetical protein